MAGFLEDVQQNLTAENARKLKEQQDNSLEGLLSKRKDYQAPKELVDSYKQINGELNANEDSFLAAKQKIAQRRESQTISNNNRNATSSEEAQIGAAKAVGQFGDDSNENLAEDLQQKQGLRAQSLQAAGMVADERNNEYIYNQQYPLEQRLAFLSQQKQNEANLKQAQINADSQQSGNILGFLGDAAKIALPLLL